MCKIPLLFLNFFDITFCVYRRHLRMRIHVYVGDFRPSPSVLRVGGAGVSQSNRYLLLQVGNMAFSREKLHLTAVLLISLISFAKGKWKVSISVRARILTYTL